MLQDATDAVHEFMTAKHFRHLPVAGDAGLLGMIDVTDVCQALSKLELAAS